MNPFYENNPEFIHPKIIAAVNRALKPFGCIFARDVEQTKLLREEFGKDNITVYEAGGYYIGFGISEEVNYGHLWCLLTIKQSWSRHAPPDSWEEMIFASRNLDVILNKLIFTIYNQEMYDATSLVQEYCWDVNETNE